MALQRLQRRGVGVCGGPRNGDVVGGGRRRRRTERPRRRSDDELRREGDEPRPPGKNDAGAHVEERHVEGEGRRAVLGHLARASDGRRIEWSSGTAAPVYSLATFSWLNQTVTWENSSRTSLSASSEGKPASNTTGYESLRRAMHGSATRSLMGKWSAMSWPLMRE